MLGFIRKTSLKTRTLLVLLGGLMSSVLFTYKNYGTTFDERDMIALGKHSLAFYTSFGKNTSFLSLSTQPEYFLTHGSVFEVVRQIIINVLHNSSIDTYHLILALFAVLGFYFLFETAYLLIKNIWVSIASFFLLVFMPKFYGDIFTNSKDIMPTVCLMGAIYFSSKYFLKNKRLSTLLLLGLFFGLSINLRPALLYAAVVFFILSSIQSIFEKRIKLYFREIGILLAVVIGTIFLSSPYILLHPQSIFSIISASEKYPWTGPILFEGLMYKSQEIPWYYLIEWIVISTPVITLLFFAWGNIVALSKFLKKSFQYSYLYIFLLFWIPIVIVVATKPVIYDSWRQFLFLSGPLVLTASIGLNAFISSKKKILVGIGLLLIGINVFVTGNEMKTLHPYEYIYFNSLVGGLKGASIKYETDYWGASFKEATEWVIANKQKLTSNQTLYIAPCLPFLATPYLSNNVEVNSSKATVSYCYTRWNQDQSLPGKFIHTISREGVALNVITLKQ